MNENLLQNQSHLQKNQHQSLKSLTDQELWESTLKEAELERNSTLKVIAFLQEINLRHLHLKRGYSSLHEYCVNVLKYSDGSAYRRIKAMRLVEDLPETKASIEMGTINLTTASQIQKVIEIKRKAKTPLTRIDKLDLFKTLEGKSKKEVEKTISALCPEVIRQSEKQRYVTQDKVQKTLVISERLNDKIEKLKKLRAHENKDFITILEELVDQELKRIDPLTRSLSMRKKTASPAKLADEAKDLNLEKLGKVDVNNLNLEERVKSDEVNGLNQKRLDEAKRLKVSQETRTHDMTKTTGQKSTHSRYIPSKIKKAVWQKNQGQCAYVDPQTGKRCLSTHWLQIDHIIPFAKGGPTVMENLRLLCASHNQFESVIHFGETASLWRTTHQSQST